MASLWELVIKQALGRPDFGVEPAVLRRALLEGGGRTAAPASRSATGGLSGAGAADGRDGLNQSPHLGAKISCLTVSKTKISLITV